MNAYTAYNKTFLNSLFTSNEFKFIESLDADIEQLENMYNQEQKNRDLIVELIHGLNDAIYFNNLNNQNSFEESQLLDSSNKIFELINNNITILQTNKTFSDKISKKIIDLLIKIEAENESVSKTKYTNELTELKNEISNFTDKSDTIKSNILANDHTIYEFFNDENVQKCFNAFSIEYDANAYSIPQNENMKTKDSKTSNIIIPKEIHLSSNTEENNNVLLISEKNKKVYLPYSKNEILEYIEQYPDQYTSFEDVVRQEFVLPSDFYLKHTVVARFRETYSLIRDREAKSVLDAFKFAIDMMFRYDLNPAIIAACKSQEQLETYLDCLAKNKPEEFKDFEIRFEVSPM